MRTGAAIYGSGPAAGLNVLEKATGRISRFKHDPADPHSLGHDYVSAICEDPSGVLWVAPLRHG